MSTESVLIDKKINLALQKLLVWFYVYTHMLINPVTHHKDKSETYMYMYM